MTQKKKIPVSLRTEQDEQQYRRQKQAGSTKPLSEEPYISEWVHWAIIDNSYPYSIAHKTHHMLIPKRVVTEENLSPEEEQELKRILIEIGEQYDCRIINFSHIQSVLNHFHIHLLVYKDSRDEMKL